MKKLVLASAVLAACVGFGDAIESQNVVGYDTLQTDGAYVMMGMPFSKAGGGAVTLDSVKSEFASGDQIQVAYVDDGVINFNIYYYLTEDDDLMDQDGWYDGSDEYIGDTLTLPQGAAVWFVSSTGTKDLIRVGEVPAASVTRDSFVDQFNMISSAFPVAFNPNDTRFTWNVNSGDQIQVAYVDDGVINFNIYFYLTEDDDLMDQDGWYDGSDELVADPIALPGQGFWLILSDPAGCSVVETSPLAK